MPETALDRRAAFGANFLGTTNLAQRRRYQEDIEAAQIADEAAMEKQFERANRRAELADPLKARTIDLAEKKFRQSGEQFDLNIRQRQLEAQTREEQFNKRLDLDSKKLLYTERKALREQEEAARAITQTDAVEESAFTLRKNGFLPGSQAYAAGIMAAVIDNPYIDPGYRKTLLEDARIDVDPDELMVRAQNTMERPKLTITTGQDGKLRYAVREGSAAADEKAPTQQRRELLRDLSSMQKQLLTSSPDMRPFWSKQIKSTEQELLKLDQPAQSEASQTQAAPAAPVRLKLVDGKLVPAE